LDITPNRVGASVDHRADALPLLDLLADVFARRETYIGRLMLELAEAREVRDELIENPGVDRPVDVIEAAELNVKAARDALAAVLPEGSVETVLTATECRVKAEELWNAADRSVTATRFGLGRGPAQLSAIPAQKDRRHAA
jgi:hypothetical protein